MAKLNKYLLLGVFFSCALLPSNGNAADTDMHKGLTDRGGGTRQEQPSGTEQGGFGAILGRMGEEKQKGYLTSLKQINSDLQKAYAALAKNYTAYRINYERTKRDLETRRTTPNYVLKNMQDLEVEKERIEFEIKKREKDKEALKVELLASYRRELPQELIQEWNKEEEQYREYLNAIYRQVGWWMQIEYSPQWREDASQFWDYIRQYYQQHPQESEILK